MADRRILGVVAAFYLAIGAGLGGYMQSLIPAMNWLGVAYYAVSWPAYPICHYAGCDPMPPQWLGNYFFTFTENQNG